MVGLAQLQQEMFWEPVWISLKTAFVSSVIVFNLGILAAWGLTFRKFPGKIWIETFIMLPLVLPPTVVGFILLMLLGRRSWVGRYLEELGSQPIVFSWGATVIAAVVVAFPLVYQTAKSGFLSVEEDLPASARSMGASEFQILRHILLPLTVRSLRAAFILGFARAIGEFGATLMLAGNIPGRTQTLPTAIYVAVDSGNNQMAWAWAGIIVVFSFLLMLFTGSGRKSR
ncbi:molybdate ABC transporter permease subunit [Paenibacillus sp. JX-17]|uniref:Molybdenum transport system permease n=1 Tax=Paenibacillus lacisoli TaxID=3064525 RepID=A0ABT9CDN3_9BACL|nr:molybdate ABC transporter permease subunit [Paenibacillus sp. JX-17]MDO7907385.1 molybdate ABC transporter permease subunit [Paenibacillus sp. JX-17]